MKKQTNNYRFVEFGIVFVLFIAAYYLIDLPFFKQWSAYLPFLKKLCLSIIFITVILLIGTVIEKLIDTYTETEGVRYNLLRITRFLSVVFSLIVAASFLFQNLYAAAVSFGLISLVLGFALQNPITSFIAWVYIVFRRPYRVGDRIQLEGMKGDVIEIGYLDTTLEECSGNYLNNDRKSGRLVHFPNSTIFKSQVINYAGPFNPFIWNETAIQIAYDSDIHFVENCLLEAARNDFNKQHPDIDLKAYPPAVYFRVNTYAWLEAVVSYPVLPEDTTERRNRILKIALPLLNEHPEKVKFPEGAKR